MKRIFLTLTVLLSGFSASAQTISLAKAAELVCHRIERLVTLKRIDAKFLNQFYALQIEALPPSTPTAPAFRVVVSQLPGPDGKFNQIQLLLDASGKADPNVVVTNGTDATQVPIWPDKDPVTLAENSLHYVLDSVATKPALQPYFESIKSLTLSQVKDPSGQILAKAEITSKLTTTVLQVFVKADGNFSSASQ